MIDTIAKTLAARIASLGFISLSAGLARAQKITIQDKTKTLPAYPDSTKKNGYVWLTPDSKESGISYFESLSNEQTGELGGGRGFQFRSRLRLVVWLNTKRLTSEDAGAMMTGIVSNLQGKHEASGGVSNIVVVPDKEVPRGPELFAKYTYDEAETQFLMLPFEYFAFEFVVSYVVLTGCVVAGVNKREPVC